MQEFIPGTVFGKSFASLTLVRIVFLITQLVFDIGMRCKQANHTIFYYYLAVRTTLYTLKKHAEKKILLAEHMQIYSLRLCGNF